MTRQPTTAVRLPLRRPTRVLRVWDWAAPSPAVAHRELLSALPATDTGRPPLLFVHGVAHGAWCFAEHWLPAAAERGFPAYAVSLRGHGGSGGSRRLRRTLMRDYVHDVLQAIVELPSPPVLVGHSMGGLVCQLVAERYPLRGLVLLAPAPAGGSWGALAAVARDRPLDAVRTLAGGTLPMRPDVLFEGLPRDEAERLADRTGRESPLAQYELLRRRRIGPVRCPVLVVGTPEDRLVRVADVERTGGDVRRRPGLVARHGSRRDARRRLGPRPRPRPRLRGRGGSRRNARVGTGAAGVGRARADGILPESSR